MHRKRIIYGTVAALCLTLAGCTHDIESLNVLPEQVVGTWQKDGTHEFWSYSEDLTGAMWDADEGFSEDFPSYTFTWEVTGDRLEHVTRGEEIDVPITRIYTITEITTATMVREDELATYILTKVAD